MKIRSACRVFGAIAGASVTFWAFTGLGFWATLGPQDHGRAFALFSFHFAGIVAGIASLAE